MLWTIRNKVTINSEELIEAASNMPINEKLKLFEKIQDDKFKELIGSI